MKNTHLHITWVFVAIVAIVGYSLIGSRVNASPVQSVPSAGDRYSWPGQLVALDQTARTITVKALVVGNQAPAEFGHCKAGDSVAVTWSGYEKLVATISGAVRSDSGKKSDERFTFPVEFVSFDAVHQNVTFKLRIPASGIEAWKSLKPGEWFRATSPHHPASDADVVVSVMPYVGSSTTS